MHALSKSRKGRWSRLRAVCLCQPRRYPHESERRAKQQVYEPRFRQADIARMAQITSMNALRDRALNARPLGIRSLVHLLLLPLPGRMQRLVLFRLRTTNRRDWVADRVHCGRMGQTRQSCCANVMELAACPSRSCRVCHHTLLLPCGHVARCASQSITNCAVAKPSPTCACLLRSTATGPIRSIACSR